MNSVIGHSFSTITALMDQFGAILAIPVGLGVIGGAVGIAARFMSKT